MPTDLDLKRAEHLLKGALCECGHMLDEHATAYDEYEDRFCYECDCFYFNGDIGEAFKLCPKRK